MRITVPVEIAVYYRQTARCKYTLHHIARGSYQKHLPLSLSVTDLRQHALYSKQNPENEKTPVLVLITGTRVRKLNMRNWNTCQKTTPVTPRDLPATTNTVRPTAADDLNDEEFAMLRTYATLVSFTATGPKYTVQHTASIEAAAILLPRHISEKDIQKLEAHFRFAIQKAKTTSTWMLLDSQQDSPVEHFNENTGRCKNHAEWDR